MIYIYDIMLNLNKELIEFFEWEDKDNILFVRKIPLYKVKTKVIKDLVNKNILVDKTFLEEIKNKSLLNNKDDYSYLTLFTDTKTVIAILFNNEGENKLLSKLIIDEEEEILEITNILEDKDINYKIINEKVIDNNYLTRKERQIKEELKKEFISLFKNNKIDKLNYYYYEYFNEISNNKDYVYLKLLESVNNKFNEKHLNLYEIIKLSYLHK